MSLIVDPSGRAAMSAAQEQQLNQLEADFLEWLARHITHALRTARDGTGRLDLPAIKERLDQIYNLGRVHGS